MSKDFSSAIDALSEYIRLKMRSEGIPGLVIGITDADGVIWERAFGHAEVESRKKLTTDHLFQIGSISKSFADFILLQLEEEGRVDLHRPIEEYIPWFRLRTSLGSITPHHLMTHTAGIPIGTEDTMSATTEVLALRDLDPSTPPGEHFHYSNTGYKALGLLVEVITGRAFPEVLKERMLVPLGMDESEPIIANDHRHRLAVGYAPALDDRPLSRGGPLAPSTWFESDTADGAICSTARDMCKYVRLILNRGKAPGRRILSEKAFSTLVTPFIRPDDSVRGEEYAYGLNIEHMDGHLVVGHTGGMVGFHSSMLIDMDERIGVIVMINSPGVPEDISRVVLATMRSAGSQGRPDTAPVEDFFKVKDAGQYTGTYTSADGRTLDVLEEDGGLLVRSARDEGRAERLGDDRFLVATGELAMFELRFGRADGIVVELLHGGDAYFGNRYTGQKTFDHPDEWRGYVGHYRAHNPWLQNLRVVIRKGELRIIDPTGLDQPLVPVSERTFRIGSDPRFPETLRFDAVIDGEAHMAYVSGGAMTKVFEP